MHDEVANQSTSSNVNTVSPSNQVKIDIIPPTHPQVVKLVGGIDVCDNKPAPPNDFQPASSKTSARTMLKSDTYGLSTPRGQIFHLRSVAREWFMMILVLQALYIFPPVSAWERCSSKEGGGICPNGSVCCPSQIQGVSACVPVAHSNLPNANRTGQCCGDFTSGCPFGYQCAGPNLSSPSAASDGICTPTNETVSEDPWAHSVPRYQLCRIPPTMLQLHGFPLSLSSHGNANDTDDNDYLYNLGYYSSQGSITDPTNSHHKVETVVLILHGSLRDADDYFCAGLTLVDDKEQSSTIEYDEHVLILTPWFASLSDDTSDRSSKAEQIRQLLQWDDVVPAYDSFYWHIWRYGADAHNAAISSFLALDRMVEYLVTSTEEFPSLQQITVVGHSGKMFLSISDSLYSPVSSQSDTFYFNQAGGQMAHRWALLSDTPAWTVMDIRVVVANPRSFAYLDERRWLPSSDGLGEEFREPLHEEMEGCPEYNQWLWGLQDGGDLACPYRDNAISQVRSMSELGERYATRDVIYLSGEYDIIPQDHDHCAAVIQGRTRIERARNYVSALQRAVGRPVHEWYIVPWSGHDHALMFQSQIGRSVILGRRNQSDALHQDEDDCMKDVSQTSRFIIPMNEKP
ncbi:hypothetical protein IV203_035371 [Nitzschia inconspicua]|uniref:Uncharacterized protein n=1 Tax=Nitzschia inconspicua TaxID=303405 RepID=A0A9K3LDN3_9STRA|nr:hypothetical protein IV203_035371 [Nitzschia inconspicua]